MTLIKELDGHSIVAWSPLSSRSNLIALGSKEGVGVGFDNYGGELQLHEIYFTDTNIKNNKSSIFYPPIKTTCRFSSLQWHFPHKLQTYCEYGIIAGGMADGSIHLYDPKKIIYNRNTTNNNNIKDENNTNSNTNPLVSKISRHKGKVNALHFNPHKDSSHLLASGGSDGEIYIMSLENLQSPSIFTPVGPNNNPNNSKKTDEITCVAWNSKVSYILASGHESGLVTIWDLKQKTPWCNINSSSSNNNNISAMAWNPDEGLHLITVSSNNNNNSIKLWDLRASTSTPLAELTQHTQGILDFSWCPYDSGFFLSCAKDNKTFLWDLYKGSVIHELSAANSPSGTASHVPESNINPATANSFFMGGPNPEMNLIGQKRFQVTWSPKLKGVVSTSSFEGKVQIYNLNGAHNSSTPNSFPLRAPKWYRRPAGAVFGFGGKLVTVGKRLDNSGNNTINNIVRIQTVHFEPKLLENAILLNETLNRKSYYDYCLYKINNSSHLSKQENEIWYFMKILLDENAREELLIHLGFNSQQITKNINRYVNKDKDTNAVTSGLNIPKDLLSNGTEIGLVDSVPSTEDEKTSDSINDEVDDETDETSLDYGCLPVYTKKSEILIKNALLVGDFRSAVDICLQKNQLSEALLLSTCGGPELWNNTISHFFSKTLQVEMKTKNSNRFFFLSTIKAIMNQQLADYIEHSTDNGTDNWAESLAILATYAKSEEFASLCNKLAKKISNSGNSSKNQDIPTLLYMCAMNVDETLRHLLAFSQSRENIQNNNTSITRLESFIEKIMIFLQAVVTNSNESTENNENDNDHRLHQDISNSFATYAELIASEGRLDIAYHFIEFYESFEKQKSKKNINNQNLNSIMSCAILRDRLYHADNQKTFSRDLQPPAFPFNTITHNVPSASNVLQPNQKMINQPAMRAPNNFNNSLKLNVLNKNIAIPQQSVQQPQLTNATLYGVSNTFASQQQPHQVQGLQMPPIPNSPSFQVQQGMYPNNGRYTPTAHQGLGVMARPSPTATSFAVPDQHNPNPNTKPPSIQNYANLGNVSTVPNANYAPSIQPKFNPTNIQYQGNPPIPAPPGVSSFIPPSPAYPQQITSQPPPHNINTNSNVTHPTTPQNVQYPTNTNVNGMFNRPTASTMPPTGPPSMAVMQPAPAGMGIQQTSLNDPMSRMNLNNSMPLPVAENLVGVPSPGVLAALNVNNPSNNAINNNKIKNPVPIDLTKHQSDGFVSSVGNKELTRKYGNNTAIPLSPDNTTNQTNNNYSQSTTIQQQVSSGTVAPENMFLAEVNNMNNMNNTNMNVNNINPKDMVILTSIDKIIEQLENMNDLLPSDRKLIIESKKGKDILFNKMNNNNISSYVLEKLHEIIISFNTNDYNNAHQIHVQLTTSDWSENKDWLRGLKALITLAKKKIV